ncbi:MAG: AmmeMemoRadiSam system radical SAM enzyme [Thermodesulfobacteriota bacterium]
MNAMLYESLENLTVKCRLCNHHCIIKNETRGICGVRENQSGVLKSLVYGRLIARHIDPIEKKPLFHFLPGSASYSIATVGCNFKCDFCQNADISQMPSNRKGMISGDSVTPDEVVEAAIKAKCKSISYTYTEPTVYFEFAYDTAKRAYEKGLKNVFVTNGYMTREALDTIHPYLNAANVDLKAFTDIFYKKRCRAKLEPVKENLRYMKSLGIFIEVTTLVIPGLNDDEEELKKMADFLVRSVGPETPWHISRFHPTYRLLDRGATSVESLLSARKIGIAAGLKYVYTGNIPGIDGEKTFCNRCGKMLIDRWGFYIRQYNIRNSRCPDCGEGIEGIGL